MYDNGPLIFSSAIGALLVFALVYTLITQRVESRKINSQVREVEEKDGQQGLLNLLEIGNPNREKAIALLKRQYGAIECPSCRGTGLVEYKHPDQTSDCTINRLVGGEADPNYFNFEKEKPKMVRCDICGGKGIIIT
jgi:hypothetical protein